MQMKTIRLFLITLLLVGLSAGNQVNAQGATGVIGATVPFTSYEAEKASTNGEILAPSFNYQADIQSEASGRSAVKLSSLNQYVEFTLTAPAKGLVLRCSTPDATNGGGLSSTLTMYVNNGNKQALNLTSKYAWVYGDYPYGNTPNNNVAGKQGPHRFFDDVRIVLDKEYPAGTKIKFAKESGNNAAYYVVDLLEAEKIPEAIVLQASGTSVVVMATTGDAKTNFLSAYNAVANGGTIYIPAGTYDFSANNTIAIKKNITIQGAGMWHTILTGKGAAFIADASNIKFKDFSIRGESTERYVNAGTSKDGQTAIESPRTVTTTGLEVSNVWIEHTHVGIWTQVLSDVSIKNCRIRNVFADGMNLSRGTKNAIVEHNHLRNTGDDGIAMWSQAVVNENITVQNNTVGMPSLANGIACYGGKNPIIKNNYVHDIIHAGGGITISTDHSETQAFQGTVTIENNRLERAGSVNPYNQALGAIWYQIGIDCTLVTHNIANNTIAHSPSMAVLFKGSSNTNQVNFNNNLIDEAKSYGIKIEQEAKGALTYCKNTFTIGATAISNDSGNFTVTKGTGDCENTINQSTDSDVVIKIKDNNNWSELYAYAWWGAGDLYEGEGWPGRKLEFEIIDGVKWYSYSIKEGISANIIFNNNDEMQSKSFEFGAGAGAFPTQTACYALTVPAKNQGTLVAATCPVSGIDDVENVEQQVWTSFNGQTLTVYCEASNVIKKVTVVDLQGRKITEKWGANADELSLDIPVRQSILLLNVETLNGNYRLKTFVK